MTKIELGIIILQELFDIGKEALNLFNGQTVALSPDQIRAEKTRIWSESRLDDAIERRAYERAKAEAEIAAEGHGQTMQRQRHLVSIGKSWTLKSLHLTGRAVDLYVLPVQWSDMGPWEQLGEAVLRAAGELGVPIGWGLHLWGKDAPHFQLGADVPDESALHAYNAVA